MAASLALAGTATTDVAPPACADSDWNGRAAALCRDVLLTLHPGATDRRTRPVADAVPPLLPDARLDARVANERGAPAP